MDFKSYPMRNPCPKCGEIDGRVEVKGGQNCVYCNGCGQFRYNAPRSEVKEFQEMMKFQVL